LKLSITTGHVIPKKGMLHLHISEYWNEGDIIDPLEYFTSVSCHNFFVGTREIYEEEFHCSLLSNPQRIQIYGGFDHAEIEAGSDISIEIAGFRNPIQANFAFNVFEVETTSKNFEDTVDKLSASVTITEAAKLVGASFTVSPIQSKNVGLI